MLIHSLRLATVPLLAFAALATGAGQLTHSLAMLDEPPKTAAAAQPRFSAEPEGTVKAAALGRHFVVGRVLDPQGKPVAGPLTNVAGRGRFWNRHSSGCRRLSAIVTFFV